MTPNQRRLVARHTLVFADMAKHALGVALVCYSQTRTDLAWRINAVAFRTHAEREQEIRMVAEYYRSN